jgi:hypothetical protein
MRKELFVAIAIIAAAAGTARAQTGGGSNGNVPPPALSPFVIWELQAGEGKPFTPMAQLQQMGTMGLSYRNDATPIHPPPQVGRAPPPPLAER